MAIVFYDSRLKYFAFLSLMGALLRIAITALVLMMISAALGCRGPSFARTAKPQALVTPLVEPQESIKLVATEVPPEEKPLEEALAEVLEELTEVGALDAEEKRLLMADLREAKRENWPLIVQQFQSALAYREQLAAREEKTTVEKLAAKKATGLIAAKQTNQPVADGSIASSPVASRPKTVPVSFEVVQTQSPEIPSSAELIAPEPPLVLSKPPLQVAHQINLISSSRQSDDWKSHLQNSIHELDASVQPAPGSTDEVNQHMRLRLLQLLAGDEEASLRPVPGATAPQQDYWNKQLFAVSTFLDNKRQPDDRRRAAGSLMHLDQARAKLAELATLEVRNLTFVDSVEGYGTYQLHEKASFRPGDAVTLYAEIENFSSESTKEGYLTRLGTSYEVVDKNGNRVDSAQFPEVEDLCQNPRRDFHMQYTVTLPTRIYAEQYELRLIITDQQSHKIGQASVPFEIAE